MDGETQTAAGVDPQATGALSAEEAKAAEAVSAEEAQLAEAVRRLDRSDPGMRERVISGLAPSLIDAGTKAYAAYVTSSTTQRQIDAESEATKLRHEVEAARDERRSKLEVMRFQSVDSLEAKVRAGLALLLVLGTGAAVIIGVAMGIEPGRLSQYLAPITGLAGIAVGYFFGRGVVNSDGSSQAPSHTTQ